METAQNLDFEEFKKALTPQHLWTFRIIYLALLSGVTVFLGIILLLAYSQSQSNQSANSQDILPILTTVHIILALTAYFVSFIVFRLLTNPVRLRKITLPAAMPSGRQISTPEQMYLVTVFTASIIRAALFEGSALFGLIICLMGALDGSIQRYPVYWLNLFSFVIMAGMMIYTFPSRTKLEDLFKKRCIVKPSHVC